MKQFAEFTNPLHLDDKDCEQVAEVVNKLFEVFINNPSTLKVELTAIITLACAFISKASVHGISDKGIDAMITTFCVSMKSYAENYMEDNNAPLKILKQQ